MATREIKICDETGSDGGGDIVICNERNPDTGREITVCVDCNNPPDLGITGEDEPSVGDGYSASGGVAPFVWSFTGGTIDSTGFITSITSCGGPDGNGAVASVSVTDACGSVASIEVRLPGGSWVFDSVLREPISCDSSYNDTIIMPEDSGGTRLQYNYCKRSTSSPYSFDCDDLTAPHNSPCCTYCTVADLHGSGQTVVQMRIFLNGLRRYYWEC